MFDWTPYILSFNTKNSFFLVPLPFLKSSHIGEFNNRKLRQLFLERALILACLLITLLRVKYMDGSWKIIKVAIQICGFGLKGLRLARITYTGSTNQKALHASRRMTHRYSCIDTIIVCRDNWELPIGRNSLHGCLSNTQALHGSNILGNSYSDITWKNVKETTWNGT